MPDAQRVLVLGGTGHLGRQVVSELLKRGHTVRALLRSGSEIPGAADLGVEATRGDLLDRSSLDRALTDCDAVVTTAIGYANRRKGDLRSGADTLGARNLADAAKAAGVRRFVLCSILTCDKAADVPHFWHKKLTEDYLDARSVPFIALRPGAFIDQGPGDFWAAGIAKGRLPFLADPRVRLTFVHTSDVARYLAQAVDLAAEETALRIDIGTDRAVSIADVAETMTRLLGRPIVPQVPPWPVVNAALSLAGLFDPWKADLRSMMKYIQRGEYVADVAEQRRRFGDVPAIESSVERYLHGIRSR